MERYDSTKLEKRNPKSVKQNKALIRDVIHYKSREVVTSKTFNSTLRRIERIDKINHSLKIARRQLRKGKDVSGKISKLTNQRKYNQKQLGKNTNKLFKENSLKMVNYRGEVSYRAKRPKNTIIKVANISLNEFENLMNTDISFKRKFNDIVFDYNAIDYSGDFRSGQYGDWVERTMYASGVDASPQEFYDLIQQYNKEWF